MIGLIPLSILNLESVVYFKIGGFGASRLGKEGL